MNSPMTDNELEKDEFLPLEEINPNVAHQTRRASQFKRKWAEDGLNLRILKLADDEDKENQNDSNVVYVNDISIPEDYYDDAKKESCNFHTVLEANPEEVPSFPKENNLENKPKIFRESCNNFATATIHANMIPKFAIDKASVVFGHKAKKYSINLALEDTVDLRPSPSQVEDFFQALARRHNKSYLQIPSEPGTTNTLKKLLDLSKAIEEDVDSDPNTSNDSGDYESDSSEAGSDYSLSDSESDDLNNSLEVPIEIIPPDFEDIEQLEYIVDYLGVILSKSLVIF